MLFIVERLLVDGRKFGECRGKKVDLREWSAPTASPAAAGNQKAMQYVGDFVASKDGKALMKAFTRLPKDVQRSVVTLVEKIAEHE